MEIRNIGFYFNEVSGALSGAQLTLRTLANLSGGAAVNVNILTHLEKNRLKNLFDLTGNFSVAKSQAKEDVLSIFNIDASGLEDFQQMDITQSGDSNAVLLAVSAILQEMAIQRAAASGGGVEAELSAIMSSIITD
ncbi:MAG: hypothetical protein IID61_16010, partial [SAR324 cluster bacterium]|nr:hypothetical protein [SAR324 cluster bacterium]